MSDRELPDSIAANVAEWTETNSQFTDAEAEGAWQPQDLTWGVFGVQANGDLAHRRRQDRTLATVVRRVHPIG